MSLEEIEKYLGSDSLLEREKGISVLENILNSDESLEKKTGLIDSLICALQSWQNSAAEVTWGVKHSSAVVYKLVIPYKPADPGFVLSTGQLGLAWLEDPEIRVRCAAGELLGALCHQHGVTVYETAAPQVIQLIQQGLADMEDASPSGESGGGGGKGVAEDAAVSLPAGGGSGNSRNLETCIKCLQYMVAGCGSGILPHCNLSMVDLIRIILESRNRCVREAGFYLATSIVKAAGELESGKSGGMEVDGDGATPPAAPAAAAAVDAAHPLHAFSGPLAEFIAEGLTDNWSQVRLAALTTGRALLVVLGPEARERLLPSLLPRLCLNRYYLADGVKFYAQQTWVEVFGVQGRSCVEKYIGETLDFYIQSTSVENHAVRECACQCLGELASKLTQSVLRPHVDRIAAALVARLHDPAWPVRDMACVATGCYLKAFPQECRSYLPQVTPLYLASLGDPIPTVRQGAAIALANCVRAYGGDVLPALSDHIVQSWEDLRNQPSAAQLSAGRSPTRSLSPSKTIDSTAATAAAATPPHHPAESLVEMHEHEFVTTAAGSSGAQREPEPWERADGCVHLVGELAAIKECLEAMEELLPLAARSCELRDYPAHLAYLETVCTRLISIANNLPKTILKPHLEEFYDHIFYALESDNSLASCAAEACLLQLAHILGPNILRGRIENYNPRYLSSYTRLVPENAPIGRSLTSSPGSPGSCGSFFPPMGGGGGNFMPPMGGSGANFQLPMGGGVGGGPGVPPRLLGLGAGQQTGSGGKRSLPIPTSGSAGQAYTPSLGGTPT